MPSDTMVRVGVFTNNLPNARSKKVPIGAYEGFITQLKGVLSNPAPVKTYVRARLSALVGPDFDGETDEWVFAVCAMAPAVFGLTDAEMAILRAELL